MTTLETRHYVRIEAIEPGRWVALCSCHLESPTGIDGKRGQRFKPLVQAWSKSHLRETAAR